MTEAYYKTLEIANKSIEENGKILDNISLEIRRAIVDNNYLEIEKKSTLAKEIVDSIYTCSAAINHLNNIIKNGE